jgi:hypothetical protein
VWLFPVLSYAVFELWVITECSTHTAVGARYENELMPVVASSCSPFPVPGPTHTLWFHGQGCPHFFASEYISFLHTKREAVGAPIFYHQSINCFYIALPHVPTSNGHHQDEWWWMCRILILMRHMISSL